MSDAYWQAFFELHRGLPREGPGCPEDVAWAAGVLRLMPDARICDAACGPGADIAALLAVAPEGHVTAMDKTPHFAEAATSRFAGDPRVAAGQGDMAEITGPFDLIWCAGALYFLGITPGLTLWRDALAPGGAVVFSEPCWFTDDRPQAARDAWAEYPQMTDEAGIRSKAEAAGYQVLATRRVPDHAWEAYYAPLDQRIAKLRPGAGEALNRVLDEAGAEAAAWRAHRDVFGYLLCAVRKL
ncbi:class I SAM-dependent methyltransferase [Roseobacter sp.]|uniref:class I SAM-dependent methyltransferase n=1 Tax=Roseobacter sp. TaxID=1907202 RepID=UPI0025FC852D|nr:class I SAM-dependent methyltransferase [Roseobacter sp.]